MYEYLSWVLLLGLVWGIIFFFQQQLRGRMLWSGLKALPFGFGELYFIPDYWNPQTLFNLGANFSIDIEAFGLMFFLGGLAACFYELVLKRKTKKRFLSRKYLSLVAALGFFMVFIKIVPQWNIVYSSSLSLFVGGMVAFVMYPNMRKRIPLNGILFALLYFVSLAIINLIFPSWIPSAWKLDAISNVLVLGVPIEEILFGFAFGTFWAPLNEESEYVN